MSSDFSVEPIVGHRIDAERYYPESDLSDTLDQLANSYGIPRRKAERIRIRVGSVDSSEIQEVTMRAEVFEALTDWFEESE